MARSLARNTQLYVSTLPLASIGSASPADTFEVKVLDGYSFSQDATTQEIGINEAGSTPVRGTLGFNTALNPVDVSFSTYVRAYKDPSDSKANCVEKILWSSALGTATGFTNSPGSASTKPGVSPPGTATFNIYNDAGTNDALEFTLDTSTSNTLLTLTLYFVFQSTTYVIEDFNVSTAEVDFSIDGIATINWSGFGSRVNENRAAHATIINWTAGTDYKAVPSSTVTGTSTFLRNKLSVLSLTDNQTGTATVASDTIANATGNVLTLTTNSASITSAIVGGTIYNSSAGEWRTIISVVASTSITVENNLENQNAEDAGWQGDTVAIYPPGEHAGTVYDIPITGATLTLENNFTYLTPEELAIVNLPLPGFSGNRVTSGSLTAYLNTGAEGSGGLLDSLLKTIEEVNNDFSLTFYMGNISQ